MKLCGRNVDEWISYWQNYVDNYNLPAWDSIPDFGLYMEQVVTFIRDALRYMDNVNGNDSVITASAINNYVRKKYMPQPLKKRYYRKHIAYLIVLCTLKQALTICDIQAILPMETSEDDLHKFYDAFVQQHRRSSDYFMERIDSIKKIVESDIELVSMFDDNATEIIVDTALLSSFTKLLSERLIQDRANAGPETALTPENDENP